MKKFSPMTYEVLAFLKSFKDEGLIDEDESICLLMTLETDEMKEKWMRALIEMDEDPTSEDLFVLALEISGTITRK